MTPRQTYPQTPNHPCGTTLDRETDLAEFEGLQLLRLVDEVNMAGNRLQLPELVQP